MPASAAWTIFFQVVTLIGFAVTCVRLYTSSLARKYRYFFAYLVFSIFQSGVSLTLDVRSPLYLKLWILMEPVLWAFYVLVVLELYSLVLERYKGLYTLVSWTLYASIAIALMRSAASLFHQLGTSSTRQKSFLLPYYFAIERGVVFSLLVFLFLILVVLTRFPVHLSRNVVVHCIVYSTFFLSNTLGLFLRSVLGLTVSSWLSAVQLGITALSVLVWAVFLDQKGETRLVTISGLGPEQEERILNQLSALNSTVLGAAQK